MKKAKGLRKRWYMLRDLLGIPSKKYNYRNNYTKNNKNTNDIKVNLEINFLKHKSDSEIIKKFHEKFDTGIWNFYGEDRKFLH